MIEIVDILPPMTARGVDITLPLAFSLIGPANFEGVGVSVRYIRDPATYVIYATDSFTTNYAPNSSIAGEGTDRVDFSVFEFGGWRGRILGMEVFGIDTTGALFVLDVLEGV